jgi:16S rRNA (uracil1498-N3)-methyltransferase
LKNSSRYEWFLEKATELGVAAIIPLLCSRTEKQHLREDRLQGILVSAMLQSQQCWLPEMQPPVQLGKFDWNNFTGYDCFAAHCMPDNSKAELATLLSEAGNRRLILIGPEGDFTAAEVEQALKAGCKPVSLGSTRLRTETAGMVASALARLV